MSYSARQVELMREAIQEMHDMNIDWMDLQIAQQMDEEFTLCSCFGSSYVSKYKKEKKLRDLEKEKQKEK